MPKTYCIPGSTNDMLSERFARIDPNFNSEYKESQRKRMEETIEENRQTRLRLKKRIEALGLEKAIEEAQGFVRMRQLQHDNASYMRNGKIWTVNGNQPVELLDTEVVDGVIYKINQELFDLMKKCKGLEDFSSLLNVSEGFDDLTDPSSGPSIGGEYLQPIYD
ncbi:hypothetical protein K7432_016304 [Basidiobolus ranarum]|uniref:Uncharacterized protein n=1 Tax=Basidiobolus ranarum TaxID=34480 RepID=A0ABR2WEX2_9FUNG